MRGYGKVHVHWLVAQHLDAVHLVDQRDAHLSRAKVFRLAVDLEPGPSAQHNKDLVSEVVGMGPSLKSGLPP